MRCVCCVGENKRGKLVGERKNECRLHEALVHFTYMRLPRSGLANLCHSSHRPHDMLCMYTGMTCKVCNSQYVGETKNPLHIRLNGHRNDIIKNRVDKPVASHFNGPGHTPSDFTIMVLEQMKSQNPNLRKYRESYWIFQLDCLHPNGMNLDP